MSKAREGLIGPVAVTEKPLTLPPPAKSAADLLAGSRAERFVIEDFRPLAQSIEWELGRLFYQERGSVAFQTTEHVPFEINNDGTLSRHAAEVLFASLESDERVSSECSRPRGTPIFALEVGPGTGLFAKFLLDAFRDLCRERNKDYYDRLCFVLADSSHKMLADIDQARILGPHRDRCRFLHADARAIAPAIAAEQPDVGALSAVFLNYVLDSLPAAVLRFEGSVVEELRVRTCLARGFNLRNCCGLTPKVIAQRAASDDAALRRTLIDLYPYFRLEYDYFPIRDVRFPLLEFARRAAEQNEPDGRDVQVEACAGASSASICVGESTGVNGPETSTREVLHSYGAIECLRGCLGLLRKDGFILINDYAQSAARDLRWMPVHQKYSGATSIGLNFVLVEEFFRASGDCWIGPATDREGIYARLLGRELRRPAIERFRERFDKAAHDWLQAPVERARQLRKLGQDDIALCAYQEGLARQPGNWQLMGEAARYLMFATRDFASGLQLAATALSLNHARSADLWDTLGDAYLGMEMNDSAAAAYQRALAIDATDVRARLGLAHVCTSRGEFVAALRAIADALVFDRMGNYREMLMQKQVQVMLEVDHQNRQEARAMLARCERRSHRSSIL